MTQTDVVELATLRRVIASGDAKRLREAHRVSLGEVAAACEVAKSTVFRWERGQLVPRGAGARRYAALLAELLAVVEVSR